MAEKQYEIVSVEPQKAICREFEPGPLGADQIRVKVEYAAAKHGTEFTGFRGDSVFEENEFDGDTLTFKPRNSVHKYIERPGNMWLGRVAEMGANAAAIAAAAAEAGPGANESVSMRAGSGASEPGKLKVKTKETAVLKPGTRVASYGSFRTLQTCAADSVIVVPEDMSWKSVMCYDPLQFALGGIRDGNVRAGDVVVIYGLGAIGQMATQLAKKAGARKVIVCDPIEYRRKVALSNGADFAIDSGKEDAGAIIKEMTGGRGADVTLEASGYSEALQAAIRGAAYNANIAVIGWHHECVGGLHFGREAHFNQPNLLFSRACSDPNRDYPRWSFDRICETSWEMLKNGWFSCENIIDPVVPFADAAKTYTDIFNDPATSVKLGVTY